MAIGDNVFNVQPREGTGSSFILGENPAIAHLVHQDDLAKQREYEDQRLLAHELASISTQSGKLLAPHKVEVDKQYNDFLSDYATQRKNGSTFKVGSPEYIDQQKKLHAIKSNTALGEVYNTHYMKTMEDINQAAKAGKPYDQESIDAYKAYMNQPLSQINPSQIPNLKEKFNIDNFNTKVEPRLKQSENVLAGKRDNFGNINYSTVKRYDPQSYSAEVLANEDATKEYATRFAQLAKAESTNPSKEGTQLLNDINTYAAQQNSSVNDPTLSAEQRAAILQPLAVKYLAEKTFQASHPDQTTVAHLQDWQAQEARRAANKEEKNKPFVLQKEEIGSTDPAGNELLGNAGNKRRVLVNENGEGDNKIRTFDAHSGGVSYLDENNKIHHLPSGKTSINGKIISFIGGDNGQVYAEITGKSKTNLEIYKENPDYDVELNGNVYEVTDKNGEVIKTMTKAEASQKPDINYYVPAKDVDIKLHGEYKQQNKSNDLLKQVSQYFPEHYKSNKTKSYSEKEENGISRVMSHNNMTREQAIEALKKAGKLT